MDHKRYVEMIEEYHKQLKTVQNVVIEGHNDYIEICNDYKNMLLSSQNGETLDEVKVDALKLAKEIAKANIQMFQSRESSLLSEIQERIFMFQVEINRDSSRKQRALTRAIIFIGIISMIVSFINLSRAFGWIDWTKLNPL